MVTRRPKRKRGAGLHRQGKHHNRETLEVLSEQCIAFIGGGNGVRPAERRIAILVGRGSDSCGVNFVFKSQATKCFSTCLLLLATMLRYLDVGYRIYEYQA
eukprot:scaffold25989_cov51-Attheya_sp.AAC.3